MPPEGETRLRDKLGNWEKFIHATDDLDPVVRMAVAHYQFEAIHPYTDGNGRTGRILNLLILVEQGLLDQPVLYLSRYIIKNKRDYYDGLLAVTREGKWERWILYMLRAVHETADWTLAKIEAIRALIDATAAYMKKSMSKQYSRELVDQLFMLPYCRIDNLVDAGVAKRETASSYLKKLSSIGVLSERRVGLNKLFVNERFHRILTSDTNTFARFTRQ
jgi:Fic family protein